jgi:hypothetical protein
VGDGAVRVVFDIDVKLPLLELTPGTDVNSCIESRKLGGNI